MRKKSRKLKRCSTCGEKGSDVKFRLDPYQEDVNGVRRWRNLCNLCTEELVQNI